MTHHEKRKSITLLDNVGGVLEKQGLEIGLEERLDAVLGKVSDALGHMHLKFLGKKVFGMYKSPYFFPPYLPIHGWPHLIDIDSATIGL